MASTKSAIGKLLRTKSGALASADPASYCNLGARLLGDTLAQEMGASYEQAVLSGICDELLLVDRAIAPTVARSGTLRSFSPRTPSLWNANGMPWGDGE